MVWAECAGQGNSWCRDQLTPVKSIPLFKVFLAPASELMPRLQEVLYSGQISEGPPVAEFERQFSEYVGLGNMVAFSSGTAALHVALELAGVCAGTEVISTPMTAEPTNLAICHAGGKVVWADVDPTNGNICAESIRSRITPRTKAVMVVHYGGIPASMEPIQQLASEFRLPLVEDAAHALGARYAGKPIGTGSSFTMFSLQAIKHMTTIDGGMLSCRSTADSATAKKARWFGIDRMASRTDVDVAMVGYKYNMTNVTAVMGMVQLSHIKSVVARHIENGKYFDRELADIEGLTTCRWDAQAEPSYWFYTLLAERREDLSRHLSDHGIGNSQCHKRNDRHSVFAYARQELPGLDAFYSRMLHIPCGWWVSDADREYIRDVLRKGW